MLKWALIIVGVLAALVVLPILIGLFLPQGHSASSSITIRQPQDSVWKVIRNLEGYAAWWPNIKSVERVERGGREVWMQRDKRNQPLPLEVLESVPPSRMVTKIADDNLPFGGTWTYEVVDVPEGSIVTVTEDGEVYNPLFRTISRFVMGHHATMDSYLRALGQQFGENVEPTHIN